MECKLFQSRVLNHVIISLFFQVQDVYDFIRHLEGCEDAANEFRSQEIDGQALMLLKEGHLITEMHIKIGPALKICSKINELKEATGKTST